MHQLRRSRGLYFKVILISNCNRALFYCLYLLLQPKNGLYHVETHLFVFKLSLSSFAFVLKENQVTSTYSRKQCQTSVLGYLMHREKKSFLRSKHGLKPVRAILAQALLTSLHQNTHKGCINRKPKSKSYTFILMITCICYTIYINMSLINILL